MGGNGPEIDDRSVRFTTGHLAALDDDALASMANKGLVRRARKDLEKVKPIVVGRERDDAVLLEVEGSKVRLTTPVTKSTCACSPGICRHILTAIMILRERAASATAAAVTRSGRALRLSRLDASARALVRGSDTFFVATHAVDALASGG